MAIVQFERNGQGYFDFESLLAVTNVEFVERVKLCVELYEKHGLEFDVKVDLDKRSPVVYLWQEHAVRVFKWFGGSAYHEMAFTKSELIEMVGGFNG